MTCDKSLTCVNCENQVVVERVFCFIQKLDYYKYIVSFYKKKVSIDMNNDNRPSKKSKLEFCVLIINSSGNSTKTVTGRGLIRNRMQEPIYYKVGYIKEDIKRDEIFITADKLSSVHKTLMQSMSVIVEIEISAYEKTIHKMEEMHGCYEDYDFVLIPVINSSLKLIKDSIRTIETLLSIGIPTDKIRILFNRVSDSDEYFELLTNRLDDLNIHYDLRAHINSYGFYEKLDSLNIRYDEVTDSKLKADEKHLTQLKNESNLDLFTHRISKPYFIEAVSAQREALASKQQHDEVFNMLFSNLSQG